MSRVAFWDVLRGAAILLMVVDHAALVFDGPDWVRVLTRPALPLFMVTAGYLFSGLSSRYLWVIAAAFVSWPLAQMIDLPVLHILAVFVLVYPLLLLPLPWLVFVASWLFVAGYTFPLEVGYEPGYVLAFLVLGRFLRLGQWTPPALSVVGVEWVGRWPLTVYVGHLALLASVGCWLSSTSNLSQY